MIDLNKLPTYRTYNFCFENWFRDIQPNGSTLNEKQKREMIQMIDSQVESKRNLLFLIYDYLVEIGDNKNDFYTIERIIVLAWLFIAQTTADCMVACKYFLISDTDYDRQFMRGKLKVIFNEGIKKLIGFSTGGKKETVWGSISQIINRFSETYRKQYLELDKLLKKHASQSSWWKETRDAETHFDSLNLFLSRQESVDESTVMIESLQLIGALDSVSHFLHNLHACTTNWLNNQYKNHPEQFTD